MACRRSPVRARLAPLGEPPQTWGFLRVRGASAGCASSRFCDFGPLVEDPGQELDGRVDRRVHQRALGAAVCISQRHAATCRLANLLALELLGLHVAIDRRVIQLRQPQRRERRQRVMCQQVAVMLVVRCLCRTAGDEPTSGTRAGGRVGSSSAVACGAGGSHRPAWIFASTFCNSIRARACVQPSSSVPRLMAAAAAMGPHAQVPVPEVSPSLGSYTSTCPVARVSGGLPPPLGGAIAASVANVSRSSCRPAR
jgi:hypothetical protein